MSSVADSPNFKTLQRQFAGHIRNPDTPIIDGIEDRRMKIYRELFFNNVEGFTASAFPVAKGIMGEAWWHSAVRDFLKDYRCESPYFNDISEAFLTFMTNSREKTEQQPAFLTELMHYEWVELALETSEADPFADLLGLSDDFLNSHPVQSPVAWSLSYQYPVHRISESYQPEEPPEQPTWLMVYRDCHDDVQFMELNALTARLLFLLAQDESLTGTAALTLIAKEMNQDDPAQLIAAGQQIFEQFHTAGILLGAN